MFVYTSIYAVLVKNSRYDNWGISFEIMGMITKWFGSLQVDWYASEPNAKLPVFCSRFRKKSSIGIDVFPELWFCKLGLFVQTISMIYRVIRKLEIDQVKGFF